MYSVHLFDKAFSCFRQSDNLDQCPQIFSGKGIAIRFQFFQIGGQFYVYRPLDPVQDMHNDVIENTVIGILANQALILAFPAFQAVFSVEDPVSFSKTSSFYLCQKPFAQLFRSAHDNEEHSCKE